MSEDASVYVMRVVSLCSVDPVFAAGRAATREVPSEFMLSDV